MPTCLSELCGDTLEEDVLAELALRCTFFGKRTLPDYITLDKEEIIDIFKLMV